MTGRTTIEWMKPPTACEHDFAVHADVLRLTEVDGGPVTHYSVELRVGCSACGLPFEWIGPSLGVVDPNGPVVNLDRQELRIPIEPQHTTMRGAVSVGMSVLRGRGDA